jgi:phage terminase large subunit-like protein
MAKTGRPLKRPETKYFKGKVFTMLPLPVREKGDLVGYEWKKVDLIKLLQDIPNYNVFTEAEGYHFSTEEADKIINFIIYECVFPEGSLTGKPFVPERWQWAVFLNMYCWYVDDKPDTRRFNEVLVYLPRKNGKTSAFGAIPALISLFVDPEKRSQNFCCAADTEQAALNFRHAAYMVEQNPRLLNRLANGRVRHGTKFMESKVGRTLKVLSSIADTKHGLSPNYVGVDEVHAHHSPELIDVMVTGTAARDSPLIVYTTTADYDRPSVCNQLHKRGTLLCKGLQSDPNFLPVIYEALPTEDWEDPAVWRKANPNFGISIKERWFNTELNRVRNNPANLNRFLRLHLNIRTSVETTWIPPHIWNSTNPIYDSSERLTVPEIREKMEQFPDWFPIVTDPKWEFSSINILLNSHLDYYTWFFRKVEELKDEPYFAGYDHTAVSDIASLCLFFPEQRTMLSFNWVPADSIERRSIEEQIPYSNWNLCGLISHSPGGTIDEDQIISAMIGDKGVGILTHFGGCRKVAFDNWGSTNISKQIERYGYECIGYPQSFAGMNQPCKTTEALMEQKNLFHGGHPVLQWMNTKIMVVENNNGAVRPDKKNSTDKIDGIVAYLTALGAWMYDEDTVLSSIPGLITKQDPE